MNAMNKPGFSAKTPGGSFKFHGRLSFPSLLEGKEMEPGKIKYEVTILLPPETDLAPYRREMERVWIENFGNDPKKWPKGPSVRTPDKVIRDCTEKAYSGYEEGWHFIALRSNKAPQVVGPQRGPDGRFALITDTSEVYPGRWANVTGSAYCYTFPTTGITWGLNNVQLLKHDTPFGGVGPRAENEFEDVAEEMDDEGNPLG